MFREVREVRAVTRSDEPDTLFIGSAAQWVGINGNATGGRLDLHFITLSWLLLFLLGWEISDVMVVTRVGL